MNATLRFLCLLGPASVALGQGGLSIGPNGTQSSDDAFRVLRPEPIVLGRELLMAELPVEVRPVTFCLNVGTAKRYGPYDLEDGTVLGEPPNRYTLRRFDRGLHFTLQPQSATNTSFGPFAARDGESFALGGATVTVVRPPILLSVSLAHPRRIAQMPSIGVAPLTPQVLQRLYDLRAKYAALANRVDADTASAELQGVPRVYNGITGNTFTPVVKTSQRDKQNAVKGAELSALTFLEPLFGSCFRIRSQAMTEPMTFHFRLPGAGDYVLCATQRVKAQGTPPGTVTAVWWTTLHFDGERPLALALTEENAVTWREVFRLSAER